MPVVNIRQYRGEYLYIGRAGHGHSGYYGNPYPRGHRCARCGEVHHNPGDTLPCFRAYAIERINSDPTYSMRVRKLYRQVLGCFCAPNACHGDILLELAGLLASRYRLLISSAEDWTDGLAVRKALVEHGPGRIVCGEGGGAAATARAIARELQWPEPEVFPVELDWHTRNQRMIDAGAHLCLTFPLRKNDVAGDCAQRARNAGIFLVEAVPVE